MAASITHMLGEILGGLVTGCLLGSLGSLFGRPWRVVLGGGLMGLALAVAWRGEGRTAVGSHWQVPRRLESRMPPWLAYLIWGQLLGLGILTIIPHSITLAMFGAQIIAGPLWGAASGSVFGLLRGTTTLVAAQSLSPHDLMSLMERLRARGHRANQLLVTLIAVTGACGLIVGQLRR